MKTQLNLVHGSFWRLYLLSILFTFGLSKASCAAEYPLILSCGQNLTDSLEIENCSKSAFETFINQGKIRLVKELGAYFNESISFRCKIKKDNSLVVKEATSQYSKIVADKMIDWLKLLDGKVAARPHEDEFNFTVNFELPTGTEADIDTATEFPTQWLCQGFTTTAKRSCLYQIVKSEADDFYRRGYNGYTEMDLIFSNRGQFLGVRFVVPVSETKKVLNDSLMMRFTRLRHYKLLNAAPYSNLSYRLRYTYENFQSEIDHRLYFEEMAGPILAAGDTITFIKNLIEAGLTFSKYKHFHDYLKSNVERFNLDHHRKFSGWASDDLTLDSLISMKYTFDERTFNVMDREYYKPWPEECDDDNRKCVTYYFQDFVHQKMLDDYGINLNDTIFRYTVAEQYRNSDTSDTFYSVNTREQVYHYVVGFDKFGKVIYIYPKNHLDPTYYMYDLAKRRKAPPEVLEAILSQNLTYRIMNVLTELPPLKPAILDGRPAGGNHFVYIFYSPEEKL